ncbi:MAG: hypothetical protein DRH90_22480 [Deltaproteobacteria bacterium]|nr:MAG: hypothetical protein DRH90_22480 [Deltaproteobacteria bacterium]
MPEVQSLQRQLKRLSVNSTAPVLQTLGSKPTDFDFEVASSTMPDVSDEVTVWLDWFDDEYIPRMVAAINKGKHPELSSVFEARFRKRLRGARAQERERISKSPMTSAGNVVNDFFKNPTTPQVDDTMTPQAQQEEQDYQDALAKYRKGSDT